jgi:hypothetical protein
MWRILESNAAIRAHTDAREMSERGLDMDDAQLLDGRYDAFIVWAEARDDGNVAFDLTITTGTNRGDVITVIGPARGDPINLVGLPCTLVVEDGTPRLTLD